MTEDTSPNNLRKFLESDDPAMVMMGLSMAKGSGLPEEVLPTILGFYFWNDNSIIRNTAKNVFFQNASSKNARIIQENWDPKIRTYKKAETLEANLKQLSKAIYGTPLHSLDIFKPGLKRKSPVYYSGPGFYRDDRNVAFFPSLEKFGILAETLLIEIVKEKKYDLMNAALHSLEKIGNLRTALKIYKISPGKNEWYNDICVTACIRILTGKYTVNKRTDTMEMGNIKKKYYTTNKSELKIIEKWLKLNSSKNYAKELCEASRHLALIAFKILEKAGKQKFDLCKIAINGHARNHALDELATINNDECLNLVLNIYNKKTTNWHTIGSTSSSTKKFLKDEVERESYYNALYKLRGHVNHDNQEKYKARLMQFIAEEFEMWSDYWINNKLPKALEPISNYKDAETLNSLKNMIKNITNPFGYSFLNSGARNTAKKALRKLGYKV